LMLLSLRLLPMTQRLVTWTDACGADVGVAATDVNEAHHHEGEPAAGAPASQSFPKERKGIRKLSQKFENSLTSFTKLSKRKKRNSKTFVAETDVNEAHHHEGEPAAGAQASQSFPKERKGIRKLSQKFENYLTSFSQLSKRKKRNSKTFPKIRKPSPPFQRLRGSLP